MARTPRILFIHDNFPAQFGRFGQWLAGRGWEISFATEAKARAWVEVRAGRSLEGVPTFDEVRRSG